MNKNEVKEIKKFVLFCTGIQLIIIGAALTVLFDWGAIMVSIYGAALVLFSGTKGELK